MAEVWSAHFIASEALLRACEQPQDRAHLLCRWSTMERTLGAPERADALPAEAEAFALAHEIPGHASSALDLERARGV